MTKCQWSGCLIVPSRSNDIGRLVTLRLLYGLWLTFTVLHGASYWNHIRFPHTLLFSSTKEPKAHRISTFAFFLNKKCFVSCKTTIGCCLWISKHRSAVVNVLWVLLAVAYFYLPKSRWHCSPRIWNLYLLSAMWKSNLITKVIAHLSSTRLILGFIHAINTIRAHLAQTLNMWWE